MGVGKFQNFSALYLHKGSILPFIFGDFMWVAIVKSVGVVHTDLPCTNWTIGKILQAPKLLECLSFTGI